MGGADTEISDATTDVALEMAWFDPIAVAGTAARLGLRSEASARFERGATRTASTGPSPASSSCSARPAPTSSSTPGSSTPAATCRPSTRSVRVRARPRQRPARRRDPDARRWSSAWPRSGSRRAPTRAACLDVSLPVVAAGLRARGRRDRGDRPPRRLRAARHAPCRSPSVPGRLSARPGPAAAAAPGARTGSGSARPCPSPSSRPATSTGPGSTARRHHDRQPARRRGERPAHVAAARVCSRRWPTTRRTATTASPCSRSATYLPPPADGPAARRAGGARRRARRREAPAAVPVLQEVVAALGLGDRMQLARPGGPDGALAGMHPGRSRVVTVDGRPVGVVGEVDPGVLEALRHPRSGGVAGARPHGPAWTWSRRSRSGSPSAATRRATSTWPSSSTTTSPPTTSAAAIAGAAGALLVDLDLFDVYRGPGDRRPANAAWPSASASRRPTTR